MLTSILTSTKTQEDLEWNMGLIRRSNITKSNIDLFRKFKDAGSNSVVPGFKRFKPRTPTCRAHDSWLTGWLLKELQMEMDR